MEGSIFNTKRNTKASFFGGDKTPASVSSRTKTQTPNTWEAILLETQAKQKITQNKKVVLISLLNIISLALILETFFAVSWILINETDQYEYWVSLLSIEKVCKDPTPGETELFCQKVDQVVYYFSMSDLFSSNCQKDSVTIDDPSNLCSILRIFRITGFIACLGIWIAMLLHLYCIVQYLRLAWNKGKAEVDQRIFIRVLIATIVFYVVSFIVWVVFSILMAVNGTTRAFFGRLGLSFYLYFCSVVAFIGMAYWFRKSLASDVKMKLVTALLGTGNKLNKEAQIELQEFKIIGAPEAIEQ